MEMMDIREAKRWAGGQTRAALIRGAGRDDDLALKVLVGGKLGGTVGSGQRAVGSGQ